MPCITCSQHDKVLGRRPHAGPMVVSRFVVLVVVGSLVCCGVLVKTQPVPGAAGKDLPNGPSAGGPALAPNPLAETAVLLDFKQSLSNESQAKLEGPPFYWKTAGLVSVCGAPGVGTKWRGISCNQQGAVVNISLPGLSLGPAPLPASFANLTQLQEINLQGNSLTGSLPPEWSQLSSLRTLALQDNQLINRIPGSWSKLLALEQLFLKNNSLLGPLPNEWADLWMLRVMDLSVNPQVLSSLPPEWGRLTSLRELYLGNLRLIETLPEEWARPGAFPQLKYLYINNNTLTGTLPASWFGSGAFQSLKSLSLELNQLHGTIPPMDYNSSLVGAGKVFLIPQSPCPGCGFCGTVPENIPLVTVGASSLYIKDLNNPCPPPSRANTAALAGGSAAAAALLLGLGAAFGYFCFRRKQKDDRPKDVGGKTGQLGSSENTSSPPGKSGTPSGTPNGLQDGSKGSLLPTPRPSTTAGEDSALTLHAGSSPSWPQGVGSGELGPSRLAQGAADALNTAAYQLAVGEVRPEEVDIEIDGRKRMIGRGSFGEVYLGMWQHTHVAVKFLMDQSEEQQAAFRREAELLRSLRHPNIVTFLGCCMQPGKMMVVTEYLPGGDLRRAMSHDTAPRHLAWKARGLNVALDIAKGLAFLHHHKIIHFDIKSGNILLTKAGQAKLADVGLSKLTTGSVTQLSVDRGTFDYMAPELLTTWEASVASDTYSFGVVMHEIITGEVPDRRNPHGFRHPRVPDECPQEVVDLLFSCLAMTPSARPKMAQVVQQLMEWQMKRNAKRERSAPARVNMRPAADGKLALPKPKPLPSANVENSPFTGAANSPFGDRINSAKPGIATNSGPGPTPLNQ